MPVHFAAARSTAHSPIARALARKALTRAANDNGSLAGSAPSTFDAAMRAALSHFAEHGMGAAEEARRQAEQAHAAGDDQGYRYWLGVCRALDSRLAAKFEQALARAVLIY